jgi:hypothetical protein
MRTEIQAPTGVLTSARHVPPNAPECPKMSHPHQFILSPRNNPRAGAERTPHPRPQTCLSVRAAAERTPSSPFVSSCLRGSNFSPAGAKRTFPLVSPCLRASVVSLPPRQPQQLIFPPVIAP